MWQHVKWLLSVEVCLTAEVVSQYPNSAWNGLRLELPELWSSMIEKVMTLNLFLNSSSSITS